MEVTLCLNSFQSKCNTNNSLLFHIKLNSGPDTNTCNSLSTLLNDQCLPPSVCNIDTNLLIVTYLSNLET